MNEFFFCNTDAPKTGTCRIPVDIIRKILEIEGWETTGCFWEGRRERDAESMRQATQRDDGAMTWSFFRRAEEPELWCAVPALDSVPRFLLSGQWRFSGQGPGRRAPPGFRMAAALEAEYLNGFYLFQLTQSATGLEAEGHHRSAPYLRDSTTSPKQTGTL